MPFMIIGNGTASPSINAVNADFTEVKETRSSNLPATLDTVQLHRHALMNGKVTEASAKAAEELALDKELGLLNQARETADNVLSNDIDELTASNDYYEVTREMIEKLFGLTAMKFNCSVYNFKSYWRGRFKAWVASGGAFAGSIFSIALLAGMLFAFNTKWNSGLSLLGWGAIVCFITAITFLCATIGELISVRYNYTEIRTDVAIDSIREVTTKIPYGAKLKVLEAKKTGIFEDFVMAELKFTSEHRTVTPPRLNIDPAILGVTKDKRMFMIVYWDIKHDIEKTKNHIKRLSKFKLTKV